MCHGKYRQQQVAEAVYNLNLERTHHELCLNFQLIYVENDGHAEYVDLCDITYFTPNNVYFKPFSLPNYKT